MAQGSGRPKELVENHGAVTIRVPERNLRARRVREAVSKANTCLDLAWATGDDQAYIDAEASVAELDKVVDDYAAIVLASLKRLAKEKKS